MSANESTRGNGLGHDRSTASETNGSQTQKGTDIPRHYDVPEEVIETYVPISVDDVRRIYTMVVEYTGGDGWVDADRFDSEDYNNSQIGSALKQLANDPNCPLELDCWTESNHTPKRYQVSPRGRSA